MRRYKGIDAGRLMFACFIPLLHIPLPHIFGVEVIQQYIARLGVPYFYAVSGMFLSKSLPERPQLKYADTMLQRRTKIIKASVLTNDLWRFRCEKAAVCDV